MPTMKGLSEQVALFIALMTADGAIAAFAGFKVTDNGFTTTASPKSVVVMELK